MQKRNGLGKVVLCLAGMGISLAVFGQSGAVVTSAPAPHDSSTMRLSLKEAQGYALTNNLNIKNAGLAVSSAQKKVWETISSGLPQVNATLDYQNMMGFAASLGGFAISMEPTSTLQAQVTQLLFSGSYWVGVKMAKIGQEVAETQQKQSELDIKQQTRSAYLSVLVAEENKGILEKTLADITQLAENTEKMVKAGVAEQTDADQLSVQVASMKNNIKTVERGIELAYNLLRFHLGVDMNTNLVLTDNLPSLMSEEGANATLATPFDMNSNYNIQLLDKQTEIANKQVLLAQMSCLPSVAMFYNYTYKLKASSFDMTPPNVIGLQATIPIFASGKRSSQIKQAKIQVETAQNSRELVVEQLLLQEKQLRFNLKSAIESFNLQKESLEVAQRVLASVTRKFRQGVSSSLDVTTANTSLLQAQASYISAMNDVITAQTSLEQLLNTL